MMQSAERAAEARQREMLLSPDNVVSRDARNALETRRLIASLPLRVREIIFDVRSVDRSIANRDTPLTVKCENVEDDL